MPHGWHCGELIEGHSREFFPLHIRVILRARGGIAVLLLIAVHSFQFIDRKVAEFLKWTSHHLSVRFLSLWWATRRTSPRWMLRSHSVVKDIGSIAI